MPTWALWLAGVALLVVRALLAASESALYGTSDLRAKELAIRFPRSGGRVLRHKTERETTAASLRIGMVMAGFLAAGIGAFVPPQLLQLSRLWDAPYIPLATALAGALFAGILGFMLEISARAVANANPDVWARRLSALVSLTIFAMRPAVGLVVGLLELLVRPFGGRIRFEPPPPPLDELQKLLAARASTSGMDQDAPALIRSIFELSDKRCRDVMVPRTEVVTVDVTTPPLDILRTLAEENHSRIPVYRGDPDHIAGILHARDLIPLLQHPELIVLSDLIRPGAFVPWMKPIGDLLREMQKKKIHMAIVVDEYGGFMGIVTLEDILREIVGEIGDEFEVEEKQIEKQVDGSFLVDAGMEVADFGKAFGFALPEGEYETLGGFVSSLAGSIPEVGERFSFNGWQFIVHAKVGARLDRVRLIKPKGKPQALETDGRVAGKL